MSAIRMVAGTDGGEPAVLLAIGVNSFLFLLVQRTVLCVIAGRYTTFSNWVLVVANEIR